ncbi:hypothetical protein DXG01_009333 [Tephrocybe rancida]|nr:hypothetical protein DXG01_009333 [Tephrocybe rancida]
MNRSLTPGKGNRLVLANTEELHDRIESLCGRIRELETALRTLQQSVSDQPHPLLQKDVLQPITPHNVHPPSASTPTTTTTSPSSVPTPPEQPPDHFHCQPTGTDDENFVDAFGTLTLGPRGQCIFYGRTARSEALGHHQTRAAPEPSRLSQQFIDASCSDSVLRNPALVREAFSMLPPLSEAVHLCEVYQEYGKFIPDSVALLFSVFAIGALFDPERQPYSVESQEFYYLARAVVRCDSRPSRALIQATYLDFSDWEFASSHQAWMFIGRAVRLAQSTGLHLDSARWKLSDTNIQRRSRLFWQLFSLDTWASFHLGRQPTMSPAYIDCPAPKDADHGASEMFHAWNWQYTALLHSVMAKAFGPKQPTYIIVLSMDRQIRDFPVPEVWRPVCTDLDNLPLELHIQRWMILASKEIALQEMPAELMRHRYIPSVMSVYRSAWRIMRGLVMTWQHAAQALVRLSLPWSQTLSAAIVMCLLVTRAPTSSLSRSALTELDRILELFKSAASMARPAANLLDSIVALHEKAHGALDRNQGHAEGSPSNVELDRWAGKTHLLAELGGPDSFTSGSSPSVTLTAAGLDDWSDAQFNNMHPTLAADMRCFDVGGPTFLDFFDCPTTTTLAIAPQAAPQPPPHTMPEIQMGDPNFYTPADFQQAYQPQLHHSPFLQTAPILDATWQTFAEQLGF